MSATRRSLFRFGLLAVCVLLTCGAALTPAAAQTPLPPLIQPGDHNMNVTVGTVNRFYIIHVPTHYDLTKPTPLVVMLHGHGGTAVGISHVGWSQQADLHTFIVVYPQALLANPSAPKSATNTYLWNDGGNHPGVTETSDDIDFFKTILTDTESYFDIDKQRVYWAGFSNGGATTFHMASASFLSDQIAAIGIVSSQFYAMNDPAGKPSHPMPLIYMIGTGDKINPPNGGMSPDPASGQIVNKPPIMDSINGWLTDNNCASATPATIVNTNGVDGVSYACAPSFELDFYTIQNMVHIWPIGPKATPDEVAAADLESSLEVGDEPTLSATPQVSANASARPIFKISGAETMWAFFSKYTLTGPADGAG